MNDADTRFAKLSPERQKESARQGLEFAKALVSDMNQTLRFVTTPEEKKAFSTALLAWAEGIQTRHQQDGCYSNVPLNVLHADAPLRKVPCFICNIVMGKEHGRTAGFIEGLVGQAVSAFAGTGVS